MKQSLLAFALLLASAVLFSCSRAMPVTLFNNTGEMIGVRAGSENETIAPGRFSEFKRPAESDNHVFRLFAGGCEYLYDVSSDFGYDDDHYTADKTSNRGIQIQIEKDFSANLLPDTYAGDTAASSGLFLKQKGFPLQPVSRKCR